MKQKILSGILGLALVVGVLGLVGVLPLRAQDDSTEKKDAPVAVEQPAESPASAGLLAIVPLPQPANATTARTEAAYLTTRPP